MAIPVQNTVVAVNSWQFLINRVNELANNMTLWTLTTDGNTSYTVPVGNSAITGNFTANTLVVGNSTSNVSVWGSNSFIAANSTAVNSLAVAVSGSVGNSTANVTVNSSALSLSNSSSNLVLTIPTTTQISNTNFFLNANGQYVFINVNANNILQSNTTGTSAQVIDSYLMATYRAASYLVHVEDQVNNNHSSAQLLTMHDNSNAYVTQFATLTTNSAIGSFTATTNSTSVILNFTPNAGFTNCYVRFIRTVIT
jgi:hypothetical protein